MQASGNRGGRERLARLVPQRSLEWAAATTAGLALLAWVFGAYWIGSAMFAEHNPKRAQWRCEQPAGVFGTSNWQWWPPGRVCHYADGTIAEPSDARSLVIVVLGATAIVGVLTGLEYARRKGVFRSRLPSATP